MNSDKKVTRKDIRKMSLNEGSLGMEYSWNYERQMNVAFAVMIEPILRKIYSDDDIKYYEALDRHLEFFNITPQFAPFVGGLVASAEEAIAEGTADPDLSTQIKASLMGPLSGIGDSIFLGAIRVIAVGVGLSFALEGSLLGPLLYLLIYNIPSFALRIFGADLGYRTGFEFVERLERQGTMNLVMQAMGVLSMIVIGGMSSDMVWTEIALTIGRGDEAQTVQELLNSIMPALIPLAVTWLYYWLLDRKNVKPTTIIIFTMLIGVIGAYFGIF